MVQECFRCLLKESAFNIWFVGVILTYTRGPVFFWGTVYIKLYCTILYCIVLYCIVLCCIVQHQLHNLMFATSPSVEPPFTPQTALPLPLNSVFPSSPLNGCDSASTPSPTLSMTSVLSATASRHPYINTASMDLSSGGGAMMEYDWYVATEVVHGCRACALIIKSLLWCDASVACRSQ